MTPPGSTAERVRNRERFIIPFHGQLLLNSDRVTEASRAIVNFVSRSCDLAGSERVKKTKAEGERLQEAQSINSSLLELGYVEKMQCF